MFKISVKPIKGPTGHTLLTEITRRKNQLAKPLAMALTGVGGKLDWVIFHEFGTAMRRQADPERGIPGPSAGPYRIPSFSNIEANLLVFPDPNNKYLFLDEISPGYVITDVVHHPGVRPKFFIRTKLPLIRTQTAELIAEAIIDPKQPYVRSNIKQVLFGPVTRQIIDNIADGMSETLRQNRVDGRLSGEYPEIYFRENVKVIDTSNSLDAGAE